MSKNATITGRKASAQALGICADSVSNWVRRHKLHPKRINARVLVFSARDLSKARGTKWRKG